MPYNPGITARGEILGQSIGAAGQSIAQQYGEGLKLQEEQKRYNKKEKQRKKDRRFIEDSNIKRAGILADALYEDEGTSRAFKETIEAWDPADVAGWIKGQTEAMQVKAQQTSLAMNTLQLGKFQKDLAEEPKMAEAIKLMSTFRSDYGRSHEDSLAYTLQQSDLSSKNTLLLTQLSGAQQKVELEGLALRLSQARDLVTAKNAESSAKNADTQAKLAQLALDKFDKMDEEPSIHTVSPKGSSRQYDVIDGRTYAVTETPPDPALEREKKTMSDTVDKKVKIAYEEADQIARGGGEELKEVKGGDERTGWGVSRYDRLAGQLTELEAASSQYKAKTGKEHPGLKSFYDRVGSLVMHMREQGRKENDIKQILQSIGWLRRYNQMKSEGRDKEAKQFADEFGVNLND